jgi:hypothetical protein
MNFAKSDFCTDLRLQDLCSRPDYREEMSAFLKEHLLNMNGTYIAQRAIDDYRRDADHRLEELRSAHSHEARPLSWENQGSSVN